MTRWPERPSLLFALAYSSALHVLVVFLVSLLLVRAFVTGPEQRETIQIATQNGRHPALIALERRRRQAPPEQRVTRPGPLAPRPAPAPHFAPPALPHNAVGQSGGSALTAVPARNAGPEPAAVVAAVGGAVPAAPEAASPAPAVAERDVSQPTPTPAATQPSDLSPGGWGQNFAKPLLADESALDDLRAKYRGTASVEVDETGRPLKVAVSGALSPEARAEIEQRLMSLRYIPAECNGLHCGGTLQLTI